MPRPEPASTKGERTKQRIVQAALQLFRESGYEATTMRMVADAAAVSLGNTYYYFASKDLLLQEFYREVHEAHKAAAAPVLQRERGLQARLHGAMLAKLLVIEPYHQFGALMFKSAADPNSPLNPFHAAGIAMRREGEALFAAVLQGSRIRVPADLRQELPALLWTYSMGVVLYWVHDDSPGRERTRRLVEHTVALIVDAIKLASNPLLRGFKKRILALLRDLTGTDLTAPDPASR